MFSNGCHPMVNNFEREERESNEGKMYSRVSNLRLRLLEQSMEGGREEVVGRHRGWSRVESTGGGDGWFEALLW